MPDGHAFRASPVYSNEFAPLSEAELREIQGGVDEGFTHIVIPANRSWAQVKNLFRFDCRIHIARLREPLKDLTWPILQENLHRIVRMDEAWLDNFSPKDLRHALLLPPSIFETEKTTAAYWNECDVYSADRFERAERLLAEVERLHRRPDGSGKRSWRDSRGRRFRFDPSMHGRSEANRGGLKSFRFCFEVPGWFHYDVQHEDGAFFQIEINGRLESVKHCNTNPWGRVWRGKET